MNNIKLDEQAAYFNKIPILDVLKKYCDSEKNLLEIASGYGQHAAYFCENIQTITHFQPTEYDKNKLNIISEVCKEIKQVAQPIELDVCNENDWKKINDNFYDIAVATNICHIAPYEVSIALFKGIANKLKTNATILIYGPFMVDFKPTTESNRQFDTWLKEQNSSYGLRDVSDIASTAKDSGINFFEKIAMPENNFILVFNKI